MNPHSSLVKHSQIFVYSLISQLLTSNYSFCIVYITGHEKAFSEVLHIQLTVSYNPHLNFEVTERRFVEEFNQTTIELHIQLSRLRPVHPLLPVLASGYLLSFAS